MFRNDHTLAFPAVAVVAVVVAQRASSRKIVAKSTASSDEPEGGAVGFGVVRRLDASGHLPASDNGALAKAERWGPLDALR